MQYFKHESISYQCKIEKKIDNWEIILVAENDLLKINIQLENDSHQIYFSVFNINELYSFKLFNNKEINDIFNFIIKSIDDKNIKIEKNGINLKFIIISKDEKYSNVELILIKREKMITTKTITDGFDDIFNDKNHKSNDNKNNKEEKKNDYQEILNNKSNSNNEINILKLSLEKLNKRNDLLEKENKIMKEENKIIKEENKKMKEEIKNENKELKERIKQLESFHNFFYKSKNEIQIRKCNNLEIIKKSKEHKNHVNALATFPSGKLISVSKDSSIKIYDKNLNVIETIEDKDNIGLIYVEVKNEDNFITCNYSGIIKLYFRGINNKFLNYKIIKDNNTRKVIYGLNESIISCSTDNTIKIWKENDYNQFYNIETLYHLDVVNSILLLEDKNMLISCGFDKTMFWNLNNYILDFEIENAYCSFHAGLNRIDEDRIICGGKKSECNSKIISISQKRIIYEIDNKGIESYTNITIRNKGIFLTGNNRSIINVYRCDNYENLLCFDANQGIINSITLLNDGTIGVCSNDKIIQILSINF